MGRMLDYIGRACREARLEADLRQIDIATTAGTTHATVSRFETGSSWPIDPDALVSAYADDCDVHPLTLWTRALEYWASQAGS
jgi:transcriptional regulator with XRE-family HTH domain